MKLLAAAVLAMVLVFQQDDAKIAELVKKLGDTEYAERENAKKELAKIGAPALKALEGALNSPDPEVAQNARELIEKIRRSQIVEGVIKAGVKLSISLKDVPFEEAAKKVGEASGFQIRVPDSLRSVSVTLEYQDAELLRVLDSMARQAKDWTYRFDGTTVVVFSEGRFIDYPAVYKGPFKFKVTRVRTVTNNEFSHKNSEVELTIGMEWEPTAKPSNHTIQILEALDPDGKKFSPETRVEEGMGGMGQSSAVMTVNGKTIRVINGKVIQEDANDEGGSGKTVTLRDIPKAASTFSALRCRASFVVPSANRKEVKFDKPAEGDSQTVGDVEVHIVTMDDKTIEVELRSKNGDPIKGDLLDKSSLVVHSGDKTIEAGLADENAMDGWDQRDVQRVMRRMQRLQRQFQGGENPSRFIVAIPKAAENKVDALKFSIREIVNHQMDFEFKDLDLR